MLSELVREWARGLVTFMARLLERTGVSPNALTVTGFLLNVVAIYPLARGYFLLGGLIVLLAGLFDSLDGALARLGHRATVFGAFLDSTLDRFSEAAIYLGLLLFFVSQGGKQEVVLIYITLVGSLMVSYARARAEGLGLSCKVGLLTRFERVVLLGLGMVFGWVRPVLWLLALLTNFTAMQRIYHVWRLTGK